MALTSATATEDGISLARKRTRGFYVREAVLRFLRYSMLIIIGLISSIPLVWMISTSLKQKGREFMFPPEILPVPPVWRNYIDVWPESSIHIYFLNSTLITGLATLGTLLTASMVAFGFARMNFPGRGPLFAILLSTLMLPYIVTLVPTFILFKVLGWIDTPYPLIVPYWFGGGAFFVFLTRQFMMQLPTELDEAALADGASYWRIFWNIILPLSGPALATMGIFSIVSHWNDFLNPLIFLLSEKWRTLALHLRFFFYSEGFGGFPRWNFLMASSVVMLIPILVLFFSAQKYFVRGIALTGITGR